MKIDTLWSWIAWRLPRRLVYWAFLRVASYSTVGKYSGTIVDSISPFETLARWDG